ncbi:PREDICTED: uncharacterized protein C2orf72 homolog [Nanorana parkeri]|uniref:uncharacterized protein C2orf72 homolog n=1 Tax=Nanorana parkeri TaxID=125878 RepID=UPI00085494C9|nr:PREDICTED: uncharacterized protein C2orf72 homolog [Nanorana parkeri]
MARDSTETRFLEVLDRFGGPQHVQLVGELWDRAESRALLEGFLWELFPAELPLGADILKSEAAQQGGRDDNVSRCRGSPGHTADRNAPQGKESSGHGGVDNVPRGKGSSDQRTPSPQSKPDRTLNFGLVFFLCRPKSLQVRGTSRQLREILRDVRERMPGGGAVIGVIMKPVSTEKSGDSGQEMEVMCEDDGGGGSEAAVSALLTMLQSVFPVKSRGRLCSEVRASALIPGQEETRRDIQRLACEALTAADELRRLKPKMKSRCFLWRRRRWKDHVEKESIQEGTPLAVLQYPNGACAERTTDA